MASKVAISIIQQNALQRLETAMITICNELGIERPDIPKSGRDEALLQARQLETIAEWAESVAEQVKGETDGN